MKNCFLVYFFAFTLCMVLASCSEKKAEPVYYKNPVVRA